MAKAIDWNWVERHWRTGQLSNVQIGKMHTEAFGVSLSEAAIRKHARDEGWRRDLAADVRSRTAEKLVRDECEARTNDREVVEEAAERAVSVVRSHRKDIRDTRDLVCRLRGLILRKVAHMEETADLVVAVSDAENRLEPPNPVDVDTLLGVSNALARVTLSLGKLVVLERQAFSITSDPTGSGSADEDTNEQLVLAAADVIKQSRA